MNKKLTARVQKLNPAIKDQEKSFSFALVIEPESKDLSLTKGTIYAVFDITSNNIFDTGIAVKVINDVLTDVYYNTDSSSPIQALEKALSKVKNNIHDLQQNSSIVDSTIDFNAIVSVLWGNVFYIVQYNKGLGYLMRGNDIKPIQTSGEGNYYFSSGEVKEDDVIILCTDDFGKKYPPNILLTKALSVKDLAINDSCLLLKFIVDTSFTDSDLKEFQNIASPKKVGIEHILEVVSEKFQTFNPANETTSLLVAAKPKIAKKTTFYLNKRNLFLALCLFVTLFSAWVVFYLISNNKFKNINFQFSKKKAVVVEQLKIEPPVEQKVILEDTSKDLELKISRVNVKNTLFDLAISDKSISPSEIDILDTTLVVSDSKTGKIYKSKIGDYKFLPLPENFEGVNYLVSSKEGELVFSTIQGIVAYSIGDTSIKSFYTTKANGDIGLFGNFIYSFEGDKLIRYSRDKAKLTSTTWAEAEEFKDAKNIQIAYSIYVATKENKIVKYTTGKKDDFEISGLETPLGDIVDFVVKEEFKYVYVADYKNSRVVLLDNKGNFVKQYKYVDNEGWRDLKAIAINDNESKLYVLSGTKLYEITL